MPLNSTDFNQILNWSRSMWTWILRWKLGSRLDPGLNQIGVIGPLLIPVSTIKFLDSRYQSQSRGILNFLVSIDPNLEWIGKKISSPSPSLDQKIFGLQVPIPISRWFQKKILDPSPSLDRKFLDSRSSLEPVSVEKFFWTPVPISTRLKKKANAHV